MRSLLANVFTRVAQWLHPKSVPYALTGPQWSGTRFVDAFKRQPQPDAQRDHGGAEEHRLDLCQHQRRRLHSFPPRLYVTTRRGQTAPKCLTKSLPAAEERRLRTTPHLAVHTRSVDQLLEVTDHPLLTLLQQVNPVHNAFDLWELTTLYQEVHGRAYWYLDIGPLGMPSTIWMLPAQNVTPVRGPDSPNLVDYYLYRTASASSGSRRIGSSPSAIPTRATPTPAACRRCGPASSRRP